MSSGSPLVSILIPAYNNACYLSALCQSVQAQSYRNLEVLIANDGSTDDTLEVLASFRNDSRFRILSWERNRGLSQTDLCLFETAKGEFWCNPGADDLLDQEFVAERLMRLQASPRGVILHGPAVLIDDQGAPIGEPQIQKKHKMNQIELPSEVPGFRALRILLQHNIIGNPSVMVRMSATKTLLPLLNCDWKYAPDWHFWIVHLATGFHLLWDHRPLHKYRVHSRSLTLDPAKDATRQAEIRLVPLCALSCTAALSRTAADCWRQWRSKLYHLWLRRACKLARKGALADQWLRLGAKAYYGSAPSALSLGREVRKHSLGMILTSLKETNAAKRQRFQVSGLAQISDPLFE